MSWAYSLKKIYIQYGKISEYIPVTTRKTGVVLVCSLSFAKVSTKYKNIIL